MISEQRSNTMCLGERSVTELEQSISISYHNRLLKRRLHVYAEEEMI